MIDIEALRKLEKADLLALLEEARELIPDLLCDDDGLCPRCDKARAFLAKFDTKWEG